MRLTTQVLGQILGAGFVAKLPYNGDCSQQKTDDVVTGRRLAGALSVTVTQHSLILFTVPAGLTPQLILEYLLLSPSTQSRVLAATPSMPTRRCRLASLWME